MKKSITFAFLLISVFTFGQTEQIIEQIKIKNEEIKTFSSKFTELQYKKTTKQDMELAGKMYFDAAGRLSMIYSDPEGDFVIIDKENFVTKRNGKKNHFKLDKPNSATELKANLMNSMHGDIKAVAEANNAEIRYKEDKQYYCFTLTRKPDNKTKKHDVQRMELRYDKRTFILVYMNIEDGMGTITTYALQHPQVNANLPESVFNTKR